MITKIHYKNFKALRDTTLPFGRFTLIVGANGTGKSTAIRALEIAKKYKNFAWKDVVTAKRENEEKEKVEIKIWTEIDCRKIVWQVDDGAGHELSKPDDFNSEIRKKFHEVRTKAFSDFNVFSFDPGKIIEPVPVTPNIELNEN